MKDGKRIIIQSQILKPGADSWPEDLSPSPLQKPIGHGEPQPPPNVFFYESNTTGIPDPPPMPPPKPMPSPVLVVKDDRDIMYAVIAVIALVAAVLVGISI